MKDRPVWILCCDYDCGYPVYQTEIIEVLTSKKDCKFVVKDMTLEKLNNGRAHYYFLKTRWGIPDELWEIEEIINE